MPTEEIKATLPAKIKESQTQKIMSDATKICFGPHPAKETLYHFYENDYIANSKEFFTPDRLVTVRAILFCDGSSFNPIERTR